MQAERAGGYSAAFATMRQLDLMPAATPVTIPAWPRDAGKGLRVGILGGRNGTIRNGDDIDATDDICQAGKNKFPHQAGFKTRRAVWTWLSLWSHTEPT